MWIALFYFSVFAVGLRSQLFEGSRCKYDTDTTGTCRHISQCPAAVADLKSIRKNPKICTYNKTHLPLVCCNDGATNLDADGCPPMPRNATTLVKTGRKAIDKCIEYLDPVFPCHSSNALLPNASMVRDQVGKCGFISDGLLDDEGTNPTEFPHMVALGFDTESNTVSWQCGGSLISDLYVLTAAHCTSNRNYGYMKYAALGANRKGAVIPGRLYGIESIINHPEYKQPFKYNDISLIKLNRKVVFDEYVRPACLPTTKNIVAENYIATGWGAPPYGDKPSNDGLKKVRLQPFTFAECSESYQVSRQLKQGIIDDRQMCFGHHTEGKDVPCQGDSGSPLQVIKPHVYCMYDVIGVSSFSKSCGIPGQPEVYTRVYHYVPWIESIVWP